MKSTKLTRGLALSALAAGALAVPAQPALADEPLILPVGLGCPDFNLGLSSSGGNLHTLEFKDADGNVVRTLTAGKGVLLTYTNYGEDPDSPVAGKSISIKTGGSVTKTVNNPDGTQTVTGTGHNGLIMFPTDVPAGPTATQYVGQIVYHVDPATGIFTLLSTTGTKIDVCDALSG